MRGAQIGDMLDLCGAPGKCSPRRSRPSGAPTASLGSCCNPSQGRSAITHSVVSARFSMQRCSSALAIDVLAMIAWGTDVQQKIVDDVAHDCPPCCAKRLAPDPKRISVP